MTQMADVRWKHCPHVVTNDVARSWLLLESNLGLAASTLDAYGRALEEYIAVSAVRDTTITTATRARRGQNVLAPDSGAGLPNATLQQQ